jgi:hypothetical protein
MIENWGYSEENEMNDQKPSDELRQRMLDKATEAAGGKETKPTPEGEGSMGTGLEGDVRGEGSVDRDVAAGPKDLPTKTRISEELTAKAKALDVEDTREETSGDERHDLVIGKELNIPPTIVQERLRLGQNPATGEPWSKEEQLAYKKSQEDAVEKHSKAVKESEQLRQKEEAEKNKTEAQPVSHVPTNFLTERQREDMQKAQDSGKGPYAQARARDAAAPGEAGRREAENNMTERDKRREEEGFDPEIERQELGEGNGDSDESDDDKRDADLVESDLAEHQSGDRQTGGGQTGGESMKERILRQRRGQ